MKRFFSYCVTLFVTISYIVTLTGFGVHECSESGSVDVVSLYGDLSCERIHKHDPNHVEEQGHECSCGKCRSQEDHEDCCSTKVVVLDDQQDSDSREVSITAPVTMIDVCLYCSSFHFDFSSHQDIFGFVKVKPPLPDYDVYLSYISQWRL